MSAQLKRKLAFITAFVYILFACGYVLVCKRDNLTINLFNHAASQSNNAFLIPKINKTFGHKPVSAKFPGRPKVVEKKVMALVFALLTFVLLSFIYCKHYCANCGIIPNKFSLTHPRFILYHVYRI
jgi:hypothetical protein